MIVACVGIYEHEIESLDYSFPLIMLIPILLYCIESGHISAFLRCMLCKASC